MGPTISATSGVQPVCRIKTQTVPTCKLKGGLIRAYLSKHMASASPGPYQPTGHAFSGKPFTHNTERRNAYYATILHERPA